MINAKKLPSALIVEGDEKNLIEDRVNKIILPLFCLSDKEKPCGLCEGCRKVKQNIHPDLIYIYPEKKTYTVEQVREVKSQAYLPPNESEHKIFIFTDGEALTDYAQNALLKILEEPPAYAIFIIETDNSKRLLSTILSRCTIVSSRSTEVFYEQEVIEAGDKLLKACLVGDEFEIMQAVSENSKNEDVFDLSLSYIEQRVADEILNKSDENTRKKLINIVRICRKYKHRSKLNANKRLNLTMLISDLGNFDLEEIE
ncbi:MAG: hypothetical protein Q4E28_00380 [Clostridia bacterium]|nr:hypothetical protein [Clostridia bacterium]